MLCELASKWESVNLQTSWQLQTCLKPAVVIEEETDASDTGSLLEVKPTSDPTESTNEATTNSTSTTTLSLPFSCNPTVPSSSNTTYQCQPTALLETTQEVVTPPNQ